MIDFYEKQESINKLQSELNVDTKKLIDVISKQVDDLHKKLHELINSLNNQKLNASMSVWIVYVLKISKKSPGLVI